MSGKPCFVRQAVLFSLFSLALGLSQSLFAGAYQLPREYNAKAIGDSGAGGAAIAEDASTAFSNPAGLTRIPNKQVVLSADGVFTYGRFSGTHTLTTPGLPPFTQTGSTNGGTNTFIPAFYFSSPINSSWAFALSAAAPFGLRTNYPSNSILRYSAISGELSVIDLSPNLAYKINNQFSVGLGVDFNKFDLKYRVKAGLPIVSPALDTLSKNRADNWGYGWHVGILYQPVETTRFGLAYRSSVDATLTGKSTLRGPLVLLSGVASGRVSLSTLKTNLTLPPTTTLSAYHDLNAQWAIDGSLNYIQWSHVNSNLTLKNVAGIPPFTPLTLSLPQHYRDTWLVAIGGIFHATPRFGIRGGVSYDESPVKNAERNVLIPDGDRIGLSLGIHYQAFKKLGLDGGWTHFFIQSVSTHQPLLIGAQIAQANGRFENHADVIGAQLTWDI